MSKAKKKQSICFIANIIESCLFVLFYKSFCHYTFFVVKIEITKFENDASSVSVSYKICNKTVYGVTLSPLAQLEKRLNTTLQCFSIKVLYNLSNLY